MLSDSPGQSAPPTAETPRLDWARLLRDHERWLRTVVYARLREAQAVDEVMQEVALAAVAQKAPLADPAKVGPWLYRLAVRQALLYRRRQGRHRKLLDRYAHRESSMAEKGGRPDPLQWLLAAERQQLLQRALDHLPSRDAEILLLKYTEDWSYRQIAEHLGTTEGAIQARLHRARAKLREQLALLVEGDGQP
ncbi:MAG: sigma-70 family RNA polymerase sigma factor [Thermoguttaceae bacterium]|nr:sigma-70 family RNA polymerase sigma factor [Thermoguttaceae bacterium]MDW8039650.1 sigma-70 family RNA polymerase sigma factor [Thermoguttaceae bacterium]